MMSNFLNYQHFPVFSVMVLFLGAFLIVVLGRNKYIRGIIAMLSVSAALACMLALIKPVMFNGEIISYWMGNRTVAGGYAIGIGMEVDALSLFFGLLITIAVFVSCLYSLQYMFHAPPPSAVKSTNLPKDIRAKPAGIEISWRTAGMSLPTKVDMEPWR